MLRNRTKIMVLVSNLLLICSSMYGQTADEYMLKAIFLGKFSHFIDWPNNIKEDTDSFQIGVLSENPFDDMLESVYDGKTIWNKPVHIKYFKHITDTELKDINLLYIPSDQSKNLDEIIVISNDQSILLVGDTKGFAQKGVHINFFLDDNKIRFEINELALHNSGFFVSYRLLNIAKVVEPISQK